MHITFHEYENSKGSAHRRKDTVWCRFGWDGGSFVVFINGDDSAPAKLERAEALADAWNANRDAAEKSGVSAGRVHGRGMTAMTSPVQIDTELLDALGDRWMLRTDNDGISHNGFQWSPVGKWTVCPLWSKKTKPDCESGGLFGQGPGGYGYAQPGTRLTFCETGHARIAVDNKVKVRQARILHTGAEAMAAALYKTGGNWPGSLDLRRCTLPAGFTIGNVDGWVYLTYSAPPAGFTIGNVGKWVDLCGSILPAGFTIGNVGEWVSLYQCILPAGFTIGNVGEWINLSGCTMPGCKTEEEIHAKIMKLKETD